MSGAWQSARKAACDARTAVTDPGNIHAAMGWVAFTASTVGTVAWATFQVSRAIHVKS